MRTAYETAMQCTSEAFSEGDASIKIILADRRAVVEELEDWVDHLQGCGKLISWGNDCTCAKVAEILETNNE